MWVGQDIPLCSAGETGAVAMRGVEAVLVLWDAKAPCPHLHRDTGARGWAQHRGSCRALCDCECPLVLRAAGWTLLSPTLSHLTPFAHLTL